MSSPFFALQQVVVDWGIRPIDILVTVLLLVVSALSSWTLRTVLQHQDDVTKLKAKTGLEGGNGHQAMLDRHSRELDALARNMEKTIRRVDRIIVRGIRRLDRIEQQMKLAPFRDDRDDAEDD